MANDIAEYRISGPYTHDNLSVFLVHGRELWEGEAPLTLQESLEQNKLVVHETGNVNELVLENTGEKEEIFIESGELVKGGRQDRVLVTDIVVPAKSGKIKTAAFCVEQGRWGRRRGEDATRFSESTQTLSSRELKMGTRVSKSQQDVWNSVVGLQKKLEHKIGRRVQSDVSSSSLQLTLENEKVQEQSKAYVDRLLPILDENADVLGFAFAINGGINSASVYASRTLFRKLWPKLLEASAVEAMAEIREGDDAHSPTVEEVDTFLQDPEAGETSEEEVTKRIKVIKRETKTNILFETRDEESTVAWLHRNYIRKTD
ncbi:MAG: ARPP-1 family domain-containing protein [Planctomycetota bacterium]|jgi:hypothetical protein